MALGYVTPLTNLAHRYTIAALVLVALHQTKLIKVSLSRKAILSILPMSLFYPLLFYFSILCLTVYIVF
nr:EamA family transporter [Streptococcus sp. oral taxon 058]